MKKYEEPVVEVVFIEDVVTDDIGQAGGSDAGAGFIPIG